MKSKRSSHFFLNGNDHALSSERKLTAANTVPHNYESVNRLRTLMVRRKVYLRGLKNKESLKKTTTE